MPADDPQIGETWELQDPVAESASQAVVVEVAPQRRETAALIRLVNRLGRSIVVPTRSFLQTWRFLHEAVTHDCWYSNRPQGCDRRASLQVNDRNGWVWVCDRHLPVGHQALLPFDMTGDRDNLTVLEDQCPRCRTPMGTPGSGTECDSETGIVVQRCGRCGAQWVSLLGRGEPDEGVPLCEQITDAAEALHGRVVNVSAIVGFTAWAAIRRIIQPASHVAGTPLVGPSRGGLGANNVIVIGDRPGSAVGVQRLSGLPSLAPTPAAEAPVERRPLSPLTPAIGSIWQEVHGAQLVEVMDIQEDPIDREVVIYRVGPNEGDSASLPVRTFLGRYTLNGRPRSQPVPLPPTPAVAPGPRAGDTWWQRRVSRPVFVVGVEFDEEGRHLVRYKDVGPPVAIEMNEFLGAFTIDPPEPGCVVGEEWADEAGVVLKIEEVRVGRREVIGSTATTSKMMVPLAIFVTRYRKIVRRSVYERLLEDDDDDDP